LTSIRAQIVRIGNSRGIRIPKVLIEQAGLGTEVEIEAQKDQLVIRSASRPRSGWEEKFRSMADNEDDRLLDEPVATEWDDSEWKW
jgi:antitoxin MazE